MPLSLMIHNLQVWLSLASEFQNQINALPAPPLLPNPSDSKLKTVRSPKAIDYDDYNEVGAETDYDDFVIVYDSDDPAASATDSSGDPKAALAQRLIQRYRIMDQRSKKVLDGISDQIFKFIFSLLAKRTEFKIEPVHINIPLWTLK